MEPPMQPRIESRVEWATDIARMAPSSHNSQPWRLIRVTSNDRRRALARDFGYADNSAMLVLGIDRARELTALPSLKLEMYLSCGMFLAVLVGLLNADGAASAVGWPRASRSRTLAGIEAEIGIEAVAVVAMTDAPDCNPREAEELAELVRARRTHRTPFAKGVIDEAMAGRLLARRWPETMTGNALDLRLEPPGDCHERAAALVAEHAALDFGDSAAWAETYRYIHFNPSATPTDGFFLESLFGPVSTAQRRLFQTVFSPSFMRVACLFGMHRKMARGLGGLVADAPRLLFASLASGAETSPETLVKCGARLMEVWLNAQANDIAIHPVSVMTQHDAPREALEALAGTGGRLVFFARVGHIRAFYGGNPRRAAGAILTTA